MPRWRPLPEELDPQIREFTSQLRRLVERSGMSVATIADRTGYSKSSWERYLGGRLLPPRGATHALGDVTGTDIRHLETMWELAERAWSRDEMRHDVTMEAIRVAQAREALGEFWDDEPAKGRKWGRNRDKDKAAKGKDKAAKDKNRAKGRGQGEEQGGPDPAVKEEEWKEKTGENFRVDAGGSQSRASAGFLAPPSASSIPGARDSAAAGAAAPAETHRPPMNDETTVLRPRPLPGKGGRGGRAGRPVAGSAGTPATGGPAQRIDVASWGTAGERRGSGGQAGPGRTEQPRPSAGPPAYPVNGPGGRGSSAAGNAGNAGNARNAGAAVAAPDRLDVPDGNGRSSRGRRIAALVGGAVTVFAVLGVGVLVFGLPGGPDNSSASPTPSATSKPRDLPAGVKCQGESCSGKDPEKMGCGGQNVKSSRSAFVGPSMVEVRYSQVCKAAWGRITGAAQGDSLKISAGGGQAESDEVDATNDAYTEMVAVGSAGEARACATLVAGTTGCTKAGTAGATATAGTADTGDAATAGNAGDTGDTTGTARTGETTGTTRTGETTGTGDTVP